ncbi:E3 ubiquitin-protein ligase MARCHF4-like [Styela clava]
MTPIGEHGMEPLPEGISLERFHANEEVDEAQKIARKSSSLSSSITTCSSLGNFCRICHESDEPLIIACKCRGSIAFTHHKCLVEWLVRSGKPQCELCGEDYLLRVKSAHGWLTILTQRMSSHDKAMVLVGLICSMFLVSTTTWLVWSALSPENATQRANELFQTCYALYGFMDVFCLGILMHEIPHLRLLWRRLKLIRYQLYVLPHPSSKIGTLAEISTNTEEITLQMSDSGDECDLESTTPNPISEIVNKQPKNDDKHTSETNMNITTIT